MNVKILGLFGALALAPVAFAPVDATAAPAGGMTAQSYETLATAPQAAHASVAPGDATAKVEKVWWRRGYGWRRPFFGYGYGWRRPFYGRYYAWHRPYWRRRFY